MLVHDIFSAKSWCLPTLGDASDEDEVIKEKSSVVDDSHMCSPNRKSPTELHLSRYYYHSTTERLAYNLNDFLHKEVVEERICEEHATDGASAAKCSVVEHFFSIKDSY